ncbi:FLYWCH family member 2 [Orycteropus afer afer]|uniref:FLYWCH family member 2 n=1 Tax=Orycteropus afer afer TaxID=1230840 RepID=A0A8B6ZV86_ORYAF|nr:FLYWCH family member 2 [Orycteropus afer afer]
MPLPEPSKRENESVQAGQEPAREPGTDVVPAAPRIPKFPSKLVLLTASKDSAKVAGNKRKGVHCIMSLGTPGPATLAKALLKIHPEAQRAIEAAPQDPEPKRSRLDTDAEGPGAAGRATRPPPPTPAVRGGKSAQSAGRGRVCAAPGASSSP